MLVAAGLAVSKSSVQAGIAAGVITLRVRDQLLQSLLLLLVLMLLMLLELSPSRCSRQRLLQPRPQACILSLQLLQLQELLGLQPATALMIHLLDALPELLQPWTTQVSTGQGGKACSALPFSDSVDTYTHTAAVSFASTSSRLTPHCLISCTAEQLPLYHLWVPPWSVAQDVLMCAI